MGLKLAICQLQSSDDVLTNLGKVRNAVESNPADIYLFPELFLTRYGNTDVDGQLVDRCISELEDLCRRKDAAIAVGSVCREGDRLLNSLFFVTPGRTERYDKLYLANFAPYNEGVFDAGSRPVMAGWKGMTIGLLICYDVMFPEIHRHYATHGADIVLMSSASAEKSRPSMDRILPARSLENTVYTAFCNNIGEGPAGPFFGGSALFSPLGEKMCQQGDGEQVVVVDVNKEAIGSARSARHHLVDLRCDIDWS